MWKSNNTKMHGLSEIGPNVPAFLIKLWKLVNDPETEEIICWSESKLSFIIQQCTRFARELLPMYYKHNNMASFIRQLNMYGFHKIISETGGLKNDKDSMEFAHQCFIKDHPYLLENIKRKLPNPKSGVLPNEQFNGNTSMKNGTQSEILARVLSDVNSLKGRQESWDARLASMKRENEALWRELAIFRQKHLKQEQIINRLIHFIVTMVQPSRNVPLRRRYPLMLNDIQPVKKITKLSGADAANMNQASPTGPTIHEIDTTDVLFRSPEQTESTSAEVEFISQDLAENARNLIGVGDTEISSATKESGQKVSGRGDEIIPQNWLEVEMTEGDIIDPLTPIDPAKVNPAMAAATLRHLGGASGTSSISITVPAVTTSSEPEIKSNGEKRVIYLTDEKMVQKSGKKKKSLPKLVIKKKSSKEEPEESSSPPLANSILEVSLKDDKKESPSSINPTETGRTKKKTDWMTSLSASREVEALSKGAEKKAKDSTSSGDPFLKLDSLYNGTICEDQLADASSMHSLDGGGMVEDEDLLGEENCEVAPADANISISKDGSKEAENGLSFEPESMAIVCQQPSDPFARELNTHVDTVQGEIDYLKEMLKGDGYAFDPNTLPWIFNDESLPYGVLPAADDDNDQKNSEESGISGNELMAYGAPNLMDLVDLMGPTASVANQEWANVFSPVSPTVSDLSTPLPSPSAFSFTNSAKKRKK